MRYPIAQLQKDMIELQDEEWVIRIDRGKRYGNDTDTLDNVATFGADGVISGGFWECVSRIKNMYGNPKDLADLKNAVQDLRNFTAYIYILETREKPPVTVCACAVNPPKVVPWESGKGASILDMPEVEE